MNSIEKLEKELDDLVGFSRKSRNEFQTRVTRITQIVKKIQEEGHNVDAPKWMRDGQLGTMMYLSEVPRITITSVVKKIGA